MWKTKKQQNSEVGICVSEHAVKIEKVDQDEFIHDEDGCFQIDESNLQQARRAHSLAISKPKLTMKLPLNRKALLQSIGRSRQELNNYFQTLTPIEPKLGKQFHKTEAASPPPAENNTTETRLKRDSYDLFFESACASIKILPPKLAAEAKSRISQIITEFELRAISEQEAEQVKQQKASYGHPIIVATEPAADDESAIVYKFQAYS